MQLPYFELFKILLGFVLLLVVGASLLDLIGKGRILKNLVDWYYRKKEPLNEQNIETIISKTGIQREFIETIYKVSRTNPTMYGENCISFSMPLTREEVQMVITIVYRFGYSINSVSMPGGTHDHKRTVHTFIIENR